MLALGLTSALAVAIPVTAATFTVTNTLDAGPDSLRQAVLDANAAPGADAILFASTVSGTIALTSGPLALTDSVSFNGPGPEVLTVDGGRSGAILQIAVEAPWDQPLRLAISGLTLTNATDAAVNATSGYGRADVSVADCVITGNSPAGISMGQGDLEIRNSELSDNRFGIRTFDPMFWVPPTVRIQDSVITGNGDGISPCSHLDVSGTRISENDRGIEQTGWYCDSDVSVTNSVISGNRYDGIRASCTGSCAFRIDASTISDNSGTGFWGFGYFSATFEILNSTITGNGDGGVYLGMYGTGGRVDILNSTISGNRNGVGLDLAQIYSLASIRHSTITDNAGGGIYHQWGNDDNGNVKLQDTIVAGNGFDGVSDLLGTAAFNLDYSLIGDPGDATLIEPNPGSNLFDLDALLGPLQDNGGPTLTHALLPGSPAIDRGDPAFAAPPEFDQRGVGFARVSGGRLDLGAYELQASAPGAIRGRILSVGMVSGRPVIAVLIDDQSRATATLSILDARDGTRLQALDVDPAELLHDLAMMPDANANGAPELALLLVRADNRVRVEVRDSLTGDRVGRVAFDPTFVPRRLAVVPDRNANGAAELAVLGTHPVSGQVAAEVRDSHTGQWLRRVLFDNGVQSIDFAGLPDSDGQGRAALAHLGRTSQGQAQVELRDAASGARIRNLWYPNWATPLALAEVPDANGNTSPEVAILGRGPTAVAIKTADSRTGDQVGFVNFNRDFAPHQIRVLRDTDHNGTPELVVLGRDDQGRLKAEIRDTITGVLVRNVWFKTLAPLDLAVLPGPWLAVLGTTPTGAPRVLIKDAVTKATISVIDL
jgi:hypothetical protein